MKIYSTQFLLSKKGVLPKKYQQLSYIESSGTQYIDTGYIPNISTKFEIDALFDSTRKTEQCNGVTGSTSVIGTSYFRFGIGCLGDNYSTTYPKNWYFAIGDTNIYPERNDNNRHIFYIDLPNGSYGIDDVKSEKQLTSFKQVLPIYLFARNGSASGITDYCYEKLYSAKLYENNKLVRHFIPCYRKTDNEIGMYDVIKGKFYTNQGTGVFEKGGEAI